MPGPIISLLTDFGARDPSAAICKGVILAIAPEAQLIDITHEVRKFAIRDGAILLWCALPYLPVGVHMAVVDPGVGTERLPVALRTARGDTLIGPDNGLLMAAADRLGGVTAAHRLENPLYRLPKVSASFHGRDIFAPAAAHVSIGVPIEALGPEHTIDDLIRSPIPEPRIIAGALESAVVYIDTFGNVKLAGLTGDLEGAVGPLRPGDALVLEFAPFGGSPTFIEHLTWEETFGRAPGGAAILYEDSYGRICLAVNQDSAVDRFGLADDHPVTIRRPR